MTGEFIYFFLSESWNASFHHIVHTVTNDVNYKGATRGSKNGRN